MVGATGIEPVTPSMSRRCSSAELRALYWIWSYRLQTGEASRPRTVFCLRMILSENRYPSPIKSRTNFTGSCASSRQQLGHFVDQVAQMDRLGEHFGVLGRGGIGIERDLVNEVTKLLAA